jgi:serine/threonine protein kinase
MDQDQSSSSEITKNQAADASIESVWRNALSHNLLTQEDVTSIRNSLADQGTELTAQQFIRRAIQLGKMTLFQGKLLLSKDPSSLTLGAYLILDKIGQGGMGSVYKARHKSMERIVAIKVLRRQVALSSDSVKRFQREVLAAGKLIHPNIVTAFDAGEQGGIHYLVMEYVEGKDLKSIVDRGGPLPVSKAVDYTLQACRALQYAHEKQIIHRDIKPANLLVDQEGTLKVLDMGLARMVRESTDDQQHSLTADGAVMGTVDFLPPEQSFDTKSADARSDIYSLGCTLFTLLTGQPVYPASTLVQKILAHRELPVPSLKSMRPEIPDELDKLFQRMVAKNPDARPQTMTAVIESLQQNVSTNSLSDNVPKKAPGASAEEAFLETLIIAPSDTLSSSKLVDQATIAFEPKPAVSKPLIAAVKKSKPQKNPLPLALGGGALGICALLLVGLFWLFAPPRTAEVRLSYSEKDLDALKGASIKLDNGTTIPLQADANKQQVIELPIDTAMHTLVVEKQGYDSFSQNFRLNDAKSLDIPVSLRKKAPVPEIGNITLRFAGEEAKGAVIKLDNGVSIPVAGDTNNQQVIRLPIDARDHSLVVEREGYDSFVHNFKFDSAKALAIDVSLKQKMAPPPPMPPPMPSPINTEPSNSAPPSNGEPRTIIVGIGTGEVPELMEALRQAKPRDTILIRHRGPLDIEPIDLTGKMPLTIQGDQLANIDFWPILRQKYGVQASGGESPTEPSGFFSGDKLELEFKNLHLAVGGANRNAFASVFRANSGSLVIDNCTVTASTDNAERIPEGASIDFVTHTGKTTDHLEIRLNKTLIRGARLSHFVHIPATAKVSIDATETIWAGGQGAFVSLGHGESTVNLSLQYSTIYNIASLLSIPSDRISGKVENFVNAQFKNSIIFGRDKGKADLIKLGDGEGTTGDDNRWQKFVSFQCEKTILANFDSWIPSMKSVSKVADFKTFKTLFNIDDTSMVSDKPPRLRVFPAGVELQEVQARDLQSADGWGNKSVAKEVDLENVVGARASELPIALSRVSERDPAKPELAGTPRGLPTLIQVNKKNGPERSLEEAFKKIQGEDVIIEITDSETYKPIRDYNVDSKDGVLFTESENHLSIRAAIGAVPKIVLSDAEQIGKIPDTSRFFDINNPASQLFLFYISCESLELDGLTFEMEILKNTYHSVLVTNAKSLKITNCYLHDESKSSHAIRDARNGCFVVTGIRKNIIPGAKIYWIENNLINRNISTESKVDRGNLDIHGSTAFSFTSIAEGSSHLLFRNIGINQNLIAINSKLDGWFKMENSTIWGRLFCVHNVLRTAEIRDSVFIVNFEPIVANPPDALNTINVIGANNAVWADPSVLPPRLEISEANRNEGFLRWLPGPVMKGNLELDNNSQLKKSRKNTGLSEEDGAVGFRVDRIANFEKILKNFEKNKRGK